MKKIKKIISVVIAAVLSVSVFAACGTSSETSFEGSYTYWVKLPTATSQTLSSFNELMMYQEMSKATGVEVDFIHPSTGSTGTEAFQILLSSGDYPDMIEYNWKGYAGGADQAINDGVIISLNDYMEKYAPNYNDYMVGEKGKENNYLYKAQAVTDSGNYYGFNTLSIGSYRGFSGLFVRKDKLDEWGLDIPVTIDDWTSLLKTAKENGFRAPLTGQQSLFEVGSSDIFNTAWEIGKAFYVDNDVVKYGPFEPEYKMYVEKMAEWVKKGYVDIDYITNDATNVEGYMTNGTSVAAFGYVGSSLGKLLPAMAEKDPNYNLVACPYPVLKKGDKPIFSNVGSETADPAIAISVQCGADDESRYIGAVKWCDYLYSDEGVILKAFGIENDTYTIEKDENGNKHYVYTDKIMNHEAIGAHSVEAALYHFMRPANGPGTNQHPDYLEGFYPYEQQKDAIKIWNANIEEAKMHQFPPVSYTGEEATEKANIEARAKADLNAAVSNIILGKASIDTFDTAVEKARKNGYDKLLKIQQAAYDRYISSIK